VLEHLDTIIDVINAQNDGVDVKEFVLKYFFD
jgi:hypothetical protein